MEVRDVLIDTNIYVAFKRNDMDVFHAFQNFDSIGLDVTVLSELYAGFKCGHHEKRNRLELETFINSPRVHLINHDRNTSEFYAEIYKSLRKNGTPIPTNDIWIASVAMQHGLAVFTKDRHFTQIQGLILV